MLKRIMPCMATPVPQRVRKAGLARGYCAPGNAALRETCRRSARQRQCSALLTRARSEVRSIASSFTLGPWSAGALAVGALVIGLGLTANWMSWLRHSAEVEDVLRFAKHADRLQADIASRFKLPHYGMAGLRAHMAAAGRALGRDEFRGHVQSRNLGIEFPGVRGFAFVERVPRAAVAALEASERAAGVTAFEVRGGGGEPELYVVRYIEPLAQNVEALGYDLGSERMRRLAIESAIDSGKPILTAPIALVQDEQRSPGFLYLMPIYLGNLVPATVEKRRAALLGLVYTPIVVSELMAGAVQQQGDRVSFRLLADSGRAGPVVIFDSERALRHTAGEPPGADAGNSRFSTSRSFVVGEQLLQLQVASGAAFDRASDAGALYVVGVGGLLLSVLLACTLWLLARGRSRAMAEAQAMTADLDRLAKVAQRTSNAVVITDPARRVVWVNEGFTRLSGYTLEEMRGRVPGHLLQAESSDPTTVRVISEQLSQGMGFRGEICSRSKDGREYWVDIDVQTLHDRQGRLNGFMAVETDITEMRSARMHLERLAREQAVMLDTELVGIVKLRQRVAVWSNRGLARMFGYSEEVMRGAPARLLYPDDESYASLGAAAYPVLRAGNTYRTQLQMRHSNGHLLWVDLSGVQISAESDKSMWLMADITGLKQHELAMSKAAMHDALTGLPNRTLLQDRLFQAIAAAARREQLLAVVYMDLDGFKAVNDTHGHDAGDVLLRAVGQRLQAALRDGDTVARLGGDEFVLVLSPAGTLEDVAEVLRRVEVAIAQPVQVPGGAQVQVGASMGLARFPEDGGDAARLLTLADERMFSAKRLRRRPPALV